MAATDFDQSQADRFARMALACIHKEYPNKIAHSLNSDADVKPPRELTPAFYGCYDWHSAVHGHWLLARALRRFPDLPSAGAIRAWLDQAFTGDNVDGELAFLARPSAGGFERPYGWAWLLMLQAELEALALAGAAGWAATLRPLARAFEARFQAWLPKATYPTRVGTHGSSAFALALAHRYVPFAADHDFGRVLADAARRWFIGDADARPFEPSGVDFLSPTLMEAECLRRLLPADEFARWFAGFLPRLAEGEPATLFAPATVSDRTDGQIAHLDGLNLSRAWCWRHLAEVAPPDARPRLQAAAGQHLAAALPHLADHYMGEHWLASFALLALDD
jgi:hypothetical protein